MDKNRSLLSGTQVESFEKDGAVVLRGCFADWVEPLRTGVSLLMSKPSSRERSYHPEDGSAFFFQDLCNWRRIKEFDDFVRKSQAAKVAATLMRSKTAQFFHDHVLVKEPGSSVATPWHQDQPYYCVDGFQNVSLWIALDTIPAKISLQCVAGSHLSGKQHKPKRFDGSNLYEDDPLDEVPDIDNKRHQYKILNWGVTPGDAVAFNFRTLHGSAPNITNNRRRVFSARWVGDDATFVDRKGRGSPPFSHLTLKTGDTLCGPDFPVIFKK